MLSLSNTGGKVAKYQNSRGIPLLRGWPRRVKSAMLNVIALAQYAVAYTRSWAVNGRIARVRLKAENDHLRQQVALLTEEIRIKDARMKRVEAQKRPHYGPTERMAILELRAARACSAQQTAEAFLVTAVTIASWIKRLDEGGSDARGHRRHRLPRLPRASSVPRSRRFHHANVTAWMPRRRQNSA